MELFPRKIAQKLLYTDLHELIAKLNFLDFFRRSVAVNALNRRKKNAVIKNISRSYTQKYYNLLEKVLSSFDPTQPDSLLKPEYSAVSERIVEYPVAMSIIKSISTERKITVFDVGCVLNNKIFAAHVEKNIDFIYFLNPSYEPLCYSKRVGYIISDIRDDISSYTVQCDLVSCLSTLEHVGMNNERYGGEKQEINGLVNDPELFSFDAINELIKLVKPSGHLLISVPFGKYEYVFLHGKPKDPIQYIFDKTRLANLVRALDDFDIDITIYKVKPKIGWVKTILDDEDILLYADKCAGAGAIAFVYASKRK